MQDPDHEVVVIGAGFSGIGAAIKLREAGFDDFVVIDDADGVGGTWHWNTYPGVAVDIPSFSYQYSFEPLSSWSRVYAPGDELKAYAEHCVNKYGVRPYFRFGKRIDTATFDEDANLWRISIRDGEELTARFVIGATGALTEPKLPDIAGVETFAGAKLHTARWDHSQDLTGKRVGVIGTGASAVQVIPEIAPTVEHLTVFQRTPIWCFPKLDGPIPSAARSVLQNVPGTKRLARLLSQTFVELSFPIAAHYHGIVPMAKGGERIARKFLRDEVRDPEVRRKLTPSYAAGCKRPSFHNEYLKTFNRDNVLLETTPIHSITSSAVRTEDDTDHEVDVLILATGFRLFEAGATPTFEIIGRGGLGLNDFWDKNRLQAYQGVSVPGFPNMFSVFGPYGYNGSSYFNLIETQVRHIVRVLKNARRENAKVVEVRREANDRYFQSMLARRGNQVFWQDSCALANSYYFDPHGDVPLRPAPTLEVAWKSGHVNLDDYVFAS
jgi:cyclohexanone monooxygenase